MQHALIIEDQYLVAMMIEDELARHGYSTADIATSEEAAIRLAGVRCPDLITVDSRLQQGCGIAAVRHICRDQAIPVIFITADPDMIERQGGHAVVIEKPVIADAIGPAIRTARQSARLWT